MQTVLVTGGTRGIGRAVVSLLSPTWRVVVGGRDAAAVAAVVARCPDAQGFVADLTDPDAVANAIAGLGHVDAVVHSAGAVAHARADELGREEWLRVLDINVVAVAELTRLLLPRLREARGQIVVINSGAGLTAKPGNAIYAASKFALRAWADALRAEEHGTVRVTSVHPGRVDTDMQRKLQAAEGRERYDTTQVMSAEAVARAVRCALEAPSDACLESISIRPSR